MTFGQICPVKAAHLLQMTGELLAHAGGKDGATSFASLPVTHGQLAPAEIQIVYTQP